MEFTSVNKIFESAFKKNWLRPAISNYQGETLHFRDVARRMEKLHIMFEECGLQKRDKVPAPHHKSLRQGTTQPSWPGFLNISPPYPFSGGRTPQT